MSHLDQPPENDILQLQLDAVHQRFERHLECEQPQVLNHHHRQIQHDDNHIDGHQLRQHGAREAPLIQPQQPDGLHDIHEGEEEFLGAEPGQLDALDDAEAEVGRVGMGSGVLVELERGAGAVEEDAVDDDQVEEEAEELLVLQDEMQARPQHEALAGDHAGPAEVDDGELEEVVGEGDVEHLQDVAQAEGDDAGGRHQEAPEVAADISLEGIEAEHDQFDRVTPGQRDEDRVEVLGDVVADQTPIQTTPVVVDEVWHGERIINRSHSKRIKRG